MRYVVIGAGAVGGTIGGLLAESGAEAALVARGAHGDALREHGLRLLLPDREVRVRPAVAGSVHELGLAAEDVLVLAVKSQQTAALLTGLGDEAVGDERAADVLPLLTVQNGVANEDAALRTFAAVHGVAVNLPATHLEPGVVLAEGVPVSGVLALGLAAGGHDALDERVAADLEGAHLGADVVDDVMAWKRAKLLRNLANALEALGGTDLDGEERAARDALAAAAADEALACFGAAGLAVVGDDEWHRRLDDRVRTASVGGRERAGGSTWQSVTRGQGSVETDFLNGEIARLGRLTGVPTPVNLLLQRETWRLLRTGARPGSRRPGALQAALTS